MSAYTPGPWAQHRYFPEYVVPADHADRKVGAATDPARDLAEYAQSVCRTYKSDRHRPQSELAANIRLIASAPDLLEALKKILRRATPHIDDTDAACRRDLYHCEAIARDAIAKATQP